MKGELITCQLIERTLTSVGIESLSVTKSTEAPSLLSRDRFSVVFLDDQRSSVELSLQLNKAMAPIVGTGSVVRVQGQGKMGIHLACLTLADSQRLQGFLLPLIP